ncbi:MAG: hypothetical protein KDA58_16705, partial [Planctomycetaceae bacterium]|nr:hypothetical protein [Planctomycetaceae bacterium]
MASLEILAAFLGLPALGAVALLGVRRSQRGMDRHARDIARAILWGVSILILLHLPLFTIGLLVNLVRNWPPSPFQAFAALLEVLISLNIVGAGVRGLQVSYHDEREELSLAS